MLGAVSNQFGATMIEIWKNMLPVIVGGAIAILGSLITQLWLHRLNEKALSKRKRAEKLEELVCRIYQHDKWLNLLQSGAVFGAQVQDPELRPLGQAHAIAAVHLLELLPAFDVLDSKSIEYERWMYDKAMFRVSERQAPFIGDIKDVYDPYCKARNALLKKVQEVSRQELNVRKS